MKIEQLQLLENRSLEPNLGELSRVVHVAGRMSREFPGSTVVGGTALRLHLLERGRVLGEIGKDIDVVMNESNFQTIRMMFPVPADVWSVNHHLVSDRSGSLSHIYRRRGDQERGMNGTTTNFCTNPDGHIALWDKQLKYHIDIFRDEQPRKIENLKFFGEMVSIVSVDELIRRWKIQVETSLLLGYPVQSRRIEYLELAVDMLKKDDLYLTLLGWVHSLRLLPATEVIHGDADSLVVGV